MQAAIAGLSLPVWSALAAGTSYWPASYHCDGSNALSNSACGAETLTVVNRIAVSGTSSTNGTAITLGVTCASAAPCSVNLTITLSVTGAIPAGRHKPAKPEKATRGSGHFTIRGRNQATLTVHLTSTGRRRLAAHDDHLTAKFGVAIRSESGTRRVSRTVTVTKAKKYPHGEAQDSGAPHRERAAEPSAASGTLQVSSFDTAIALEPGGDDRLTGSLDRDWWGATGPHGGYLAAILAQAALSTAGPRQELRSLTIHFLGGARTGPIEVRLDRLRATRTSTAVHLTMRQGTDVLVTALAALAVGRSSVEFDDATMPEVTRYELTEVSRFMMSRGVSDIAPPFATQLEYRHAFGPEPLSGGSEAVTGGWLKLLDGRPIDVPAAAMLTDAWWPAAWSRLREIPRTPTVALTVNFRRPLPAVAKPVFAIFRSRLGVDGFVDEDGELWSADGQLLVQSRQLAVLLAGPNAV